jgi:hypothetical protein
MEVVKRKPGRPKKIHVVEEAPKEKKISFRSYMEDFLLSDIKPQDPRQDPMVLIYDELCNRMRERQEYFLPIGLSPWQVRQTILTVRQLGVDTERNVVLRVLLEEITKSIVKVALDAQSGRHGQLDS